MEFDVSHEFSSDSSTIIGTAMPGSIVTITQSGITVGKAISDENGIFRYRLTTTGTGIVNYNLTIEDGTTTYTGTYVVNKDNSSNKNSLVVDSIVDNQVYTHNKLVLTGFGKPNSVVRIEKTEDGSFVANFIIAEDGAFEYVAKDYILSEGVHRLKLTNKLTNMVVYKTFVYEKTNDCKNDKCTIGILSYGATL